MTAPALNNPNGQDHEQLTRAEEAVVAAIALFLASRLAVKAVRLPVVLVDRLVGLGLSRRAVLTASRMVLKPPLTGRGRFGSPTVPDVAETVSAIRQVAAGEPTMRALYLLNASKRLTTALTEGKFSKALAKERRYMAQHRAAGIDRRAGAARVDTVAKRAHGWLVWVGGTCPQCKPLDGQVFRVGEMPLPPLHSGCSCGVRAL